MREQSTRSYIDHASTISALTALACQGVRMTEKFSSRAEVGVYQRVGKRNRGARERNARLRSVRRSSEAPRPKNWYLCFARCARDDIKCRFLKEGTAITSREMSLAGDGMMAEPGVARTGPCRI